MDEKGETKIELIRKQSESNINSVMLFSYNIMDVLGKGYKNHKYQCFILSSKIELFLRWQGIASDSFRQIFFLFSYAHSFTIISGVPGKILRSSSHFIACSPTYSSLLPRKCEYRGVLSTSRSSLSLFIVERLDMVNFTGEASESRAE